MTEGLKERPAQLRRTPRPAPDEKVDPVDYTPAVVAPAVSSPAVPVEALVQPPVEDAAAAGGEVESEQAPVQAAAAPAVQPAIETPAPAAAKPKQAPRTPRAAKPVSRKASRREVTFPLSTRISEEVSDILYSTAEEQDLSVREVIEQAIKARWGQG